MRIGIHLGDVLFRDERVYGDGVNVASRIRGLAEPGGICVSDEVQHSIQNQANVETRALGEHELRNVPRPIPVFAVSGTALAPRALPAPGRSPAQIRRWWSYALGVLVVVGLAVWWIGRPAGGPGDIRSLAVLPLENLTGDPAQEYFVDGMTEALISDLAKIRALQVISRTSVMQYKGERKPLPDIADELNVDAVIEGTVMRAGDRVRITAQLIDARRDVHLWAESYERDLRDVLSLQSEVARAIAKEIRVTVTPGEERRLASARKVDPAAHEAYLRGRYHWYKRTAEGVRTGIEFFEKSIDIDPAYAPAYAGLADAWAILGSFSYGDVSAEQAMPRAKAAATKAVDLDKDLAEANNSLGIVLLWYDWDWRAAERQIGRAIELNPSYAFAHLAYSEVLSVMGKGEESVAWAERGHQLDPLSSILGTVVGVRLTEDRQHDRAIERARQVLDDDPGFVVAYQSLGLAQAARSDYPEAIATFRKLVELSARDPDALGFLAMSYGRAGDRERALSLIQELEALEESRYVPPEVFAFAYTGLGDADQAFLWLERAFQGRSRRLLYLHRDPAWDPVRSDPRFDDLLRRIGLPELD